MLAWLSGKWPGSWELCDVQQDDRCKGQDHANEDMPLEKVVQVKVSAHCISWIVIWSVQVDLGPRLRPQGRRMSVRIDIKATAYTSSFTDMCILLDMR